MSKSRCSKSLGGGVSSFSLLLLGFSRFGENLLKTSTRNKNSGKQSGFTLAEVLITLGIIGVVAAMTLPTLVQNYKEKATVTQLKKANSVLNQAYRLAMAEYGPISDWFSEPSLLADASGETPAVTIDNSKILLERLSKYMKTTSVCYRNNSECKLEYDMYSLNGSLHSNKGTNISLIKLSDGAYLFNGWVSRTNCNNYSNCADFQVDINGKNPPNTVGIDIFSFLVTENSIVPNGTPSIQTSEGTFPKRCSKNSSIDRNGYACAAWVIYNENMDYLHCDDLSWDGKTKCK